MRSAHIQQSAGHHAVTHYITSHYSKVLRVYAVITVMRLIPLYSEGGMVGNQVSRAMRGKIITTATGALRHPTTHLSTRHQRRGRERVA